ncbi:transglycosylase domain-containing protein [Irregularibacter muris]|uniref:Penicillin-binding protein 1A n=1 Tax=Irregularibacter muris TaxID=1796619 RepID=A0AAE3HCC2_9FIRM|nr:transglycosylase domain-containing protein [Irregularibacter muris]MCR1897370.1 transglycosylase domain-containing protein [Irregularibacter muris]
MKERSLEQGGSTITQQLAKNLFLTREKTLNRKIKELFLAWKLERTYSKEEILEMYLNNSYFGAGAYGIQEASQSFFHKEVQDLNTEECALLAGVLKGPSIYNPQEHLEQAQKRQTLVLRLMKEKGYIE